MGGNVKRRSSWFAALIVRLLFTLIVVIGSTTTMIRIIDRERVSCVAINQAHIIDVRHGADIWNYQFIPSSVMPSSIIASPVQDIPYPSPDGNYIIHDTYKDGKHSLSLSDATGEHKRPISNEVEFQGWSADSRYFATGVNFSAGAIWSTATVQPIQQLDGGFLAHWSPIGHLLFYRTKAKVHVVNPETMTSDIVYHISATAMAAYTRIVWSQDAKYIAFVNVIPLNPQDSQYLHTVVNLENSKSIQFVSSVTREQSSLAHLGYWMNGSSNYLFVNVRQVHDHVQTDLVTLHPATGTLKLFVADIRKLQAPVGDNPRYVAYTFLDNGKWSVETLDLETGQRVSVLNRVDRLLTEPKWSLNGKWIAIVGTSGNSTTGLNRVHVVAMRPDGTQAQDFGDVSKDWAVLGWQTDRPDWFAYATDADLGVQLTLVDLEHGKRIPILSQLTRDTSWRSWRVFLSPNGEQAVIGFRLNDWDENAGYENTYVVSLNNSSLFNLSKYYIDQVVWSPDSTMIAFTTSINTKKPKVIVVSASGDVLREKRESEHDRLTWTNCAPPLREIYQP